MQEIIKEYGPALLAVIAVISLTALIVALIGKGEGSVVGTQFATLIKGFFTKANAALVN
ncbi:MAG: hypothetical protein K6F30_08490 [Lachnospiraceae bacterium]|nr:hypothetical protein [Lachnospiraceae bacterium]